MCQWCLRPAKNNTWAAKEKGYDAGKQVSDIKRLIAVDTNGLIHAIEITTANITDHLGAIQMCQRHAEALEQVKNMLFDGTYTGKPLVQVIKVTLDYSGSVETIKRSGLHRFGVLPNRQVVERTFS
ncbi:transposase [Bacillus toyonensis]|uniref:transposase n=1 Tax=Bacillus toyonensis TaxID=155322 RepID=UPI003D6611C4